MNSSSTRVAAQKANGERGQFGELPQAPNTHLQLDSNTEMPTAAGYLYSAARQVSELVSGIGALDLEDQELERWATECESHADIQAACMWAITEGIDVPSSVTYLQDADERWQQLADALRQPSDDTYNEQRRADASVAALKARRAIGSFLDLHGPQHPLPLPADRGPTSRFIYPRRDTLTALAENPDSIEAVFGPDRPAAARQLHWIVESITPTTTDRITAALTDNHALRRRIRAYDNGRSKLSELYHEYGELQHLPTSVKE